ncbi:hypothetical protein K502DRAFT_349647 [Neoconidiobolus thromboides FSU 785]|nr:hypothetical protein K502DRAFT_349647 [Neoconidiobolus thromboides FSU 785]
MYKYISTILILTSSTIILSHSTLPKTCLFKQVFTTFPSVFDIDEFSNIQYNNRPHSTPPIFNLNNNFGWAGTNTVKTSPSNFNSCSLPSIFDDSCLNANITTFRKYESNKNKKATI